MASSRQISLLLIFEALEDDGFEAIQQIEKKCEPCVNPVIALICGQSTFSTRKPALFNHRLAGFVQSDVPRYNEPTFKAHFRMERSTFEMLLQDLAPNLTSRGVHHDTKILSTLCLLSTTESYRSVADRFGMSKGSLHHHVVEVVTILSDAASRHILWPSGQEMLAMANEVETKHGFPGTFGFIDGCHIAIKGRSTERDSFINRLGHSSILLQGVCNEKLLFIHMYAGWPGSVHDARVFRNSDLPSLLSAVPEELHILGDSAFPLQPFLLTPYKDNGRLTETQKRYNVVHGSTRSAVERSFALLKGKFRRLKYLDMSLDLVMPKVVGSCVVLHNFILSHEADPDLSLADQDHTIMDILMDIWLDPLTHLPLLKGMLYLLCFKLTVAP